MKAGCRQGAESERPDADRSHSDGHFISRGVVTVAAAAAGLVVVVVQASGSGADPSHGSEPDPDPDPDPDWVGLV